MRPPQIAFPALLQDFFHQRLIAQRGASAQTIASYRDTFELLLRYTEQSTGRSPSTLTLDDLDAPRVLTFLDHLETVRGNSPRTRNHRRTASRPSMRYASLRDPTALAAAQRVRAIPTKRFDRPSRFLSREEVKALLDAPTAPWSGQRDAVMLATLYNTGARVSEVTGLRVADVLLDRASALHLHGKVARSESFRCGRARRRNFARGSSASIAAPTPRSSPIAPAHGCRVPVSSIASMSRSRQPRSAARRSPGAGSRPIPCATPRRCTCSSPAWTSRSSRCGLATRIRRPRTSTSRRILR